MFLVRTLSIAPAGSLTTAMVVYIIVLKPGLILLMVAVELALVNITAGSKTSQPANLMHRISGAHSVFSILHRSVLCGRGPSVVDTLLMKTMPRSRETGLLKVEHILSVQLL